jgi:hypothetical protein
MNADLTGGQTMADFKAIEKLGAKEKIHRTKRGDQTSRQTAKHIEGLKDSHGVELGGGRKKEARVPKKKR